MSGNTVFAAIHETRSVMDYACNAFTRKARTGLFRALLGLVLTLPAVVAGCAVMDTVDDRVKFDLTGPPTIYRDQWARRQPPVVYVQPAESSESQLTAMFFPFRVTQKISDPEIIGHTQGRVFWQTWLNQRLFSIIEFDADHGPYRRDRAIALARARGADLAIGGFVTYYYAGGSEWDSQVAVQVEIYDTASGQLVWSMAQSALMPAREVNNYVVFATETRLPSDPMYALAKTMAEDMGAIISRWVQPVDGPRFDQKNGVAPRPVKPSF